MRRPLRAHERAHLERLGRLLSTTRRAVGLTQESLALTAGLSRTHVDRLEHGTRRTRRSTLTRIAAVFVHEVPRLGPVDRLVDDLVSTAGPALAEESVYAERVTRRRRLRVETAYRQAKRREELALWRLLYVQEHSRDQWRTEEQMDELRAEMWGYLEQRMQEVEQRRRELEQFG